MVGYEYFNSKEELIEEFILFTKFICKDIAIVKSSLDSDEYL